MNYSDYLKTYEQKTFYLWAIMIAGIVLEIMNIYPESLIFLAAAFMAIMYLNQLKLGWSSQKIANLLKHHEITGTSFSILEQEMLDRYFGRGRKQQIIDQDELVHWKTRTWIVTFILLGSIIIGAVVAYYIKIII